MKRICRRFAWFDPGGWGEEVARGAPVVLVIQMAGAGVTYLLHIVLARVLQPAGYGVYAFVMAWAAILAIPAGLGFSTSLVRFIPEYRGAGAIGLLRGVALRSWQLVSGSGILIAIGGMGLILWGDGRFAPPYTSALLVGLWVVPLRALMTTQKAMGRGLKKMTLAYGPGQIMQPVFLIGGIALLLGLGASIDSRTALGLVVITFFMSVLLQGILLGRRILSMTGGSKAEYRTRYWLRISLPMLLIAGFLLLLNRTDVLMLGILANAEDVGTYNAASRTANLASFVLVAVNAIAGPSIASLYHAGRKEELQNLASTVAHLIFWPSVTVVVFLILLAPYILGLFGSAFVRGEAVLVILAVGHLVNVGVGSVGYFMNMTGNQDEMARIVGVAAGVNIVLNGLAIPYFGATGAAVATALSMASWNIWLNRRVVARLKIRPSILFAISRSLGHQD